MKTITVNKLIGFMLKNYITFVLSVIIFYPIALMYYFYINVINEMINGIKLGWKLFKNDVSFVPTFSREHYEKKKEQFDKTGSVI